MKLKYDGSNYDEFVQALPPEALPIYQQLETDSLDGLDYEQLADYLTRLERLGVTFDYGLDAEPYDFEILEKTEV